MNDDQKFFNNESTGRVLDFWDKAKIFEKSVAKAAPKGEYIFYDGPPFATGLPHYGHIVASTMKDAIPRYRTMRGYRVERKWGWDCHGLPIENIAEKELGSKKKKDIEEMGVAKFNEICRSKVLEYVEGWKVIMRKLGRWVDMENDYKTMDLSFMESVWWVFKELWDKGLIYEGHRVMHICTRCETTLSQSEVSEGYKLVKDLSAIVKFKITDKNFLNKYCAGALTSFLAWTTTLWSIPTTMGLAIGEKLDYVIVKIKKSEAANAREGEQFIFVKNRLDFVMKNFTSDQYEIVREIKGGELEYISYVHPFANIYASHPKVKDNANAYKTHFTDYVSVEDGTGIVTINGAFGDIDMEASKKLDLPVVVNVNMDGTFTEEMGEFAGMRVKPLENREATDVEIIKYLARNNYLFAKEKYEHSYPHCWRCETPLINYATSSWFVNILKIKERALDLAKNINWFPSHIKEGRFGNWMSGARDWSISRQRFWASVIPIWKCKCGEIKIFGSVAELEKASGRKITDIHKHIVDKIAFPCEKCGGEMKRIPDVLDAWFDSASMPYAQMHYPFENKEKFDDNFPAEFIAEGDDQTRCWFYYLHIIGTAIRDSHAFKNVIVNGIVLAEDGKKMSKKLKNYPDPAIVIDKYGADALRFYLLSSPVVAAENLNFSEDGVKEVLRKNMMTLWNVLNFYELFNDSESINPEELFFKNIWQRSDNALDKWVLISLNKLIGSVTDGMENYNLIASTRPITDFIDGLSTWYIRRSRGRFKSDNQKEREAVLAITAFALDQISKLIAPFTPFLAEQIWQKISGNDFKNNDKSVHLEPWPAVFDIPSDIASDVLEKMNLVRKIVERGSAERKNKGIKIRQPLQKLIIKNNTNIIKQLNDDYISLIKDEVNVKDVVFVENEDSLTVELDTHITKELKLEGLAREIIRTINSLRKEANLSVDDTAVLYYFDNKILNEVFEKFKKDILKDVACSDYKKSDMNDIKFKKEIAIEGEKCLMGIKINRENQ